MGKGILLLLLEVSLLESLESLDVPEEEDVGVVNGEHLGLVGDEGNELDVELVCLWEKCLDAIPAVQLDVAVLGANSEEHVHGVIRH